MVLMQILYIQIKLGQVLNYNLLAIAKVKTQGTYEEQT